MKELDTTATIFSIVKHIQHYFINNGPGCKAIIGISGGKDSTIVAMLCVLALGPERVYGVLMPEGEQTDIEDSRRVCKALGIDSIEVNIGKTCEELYRAISWGDCSELPQITTNTPARIRMATLYAVAALEHGRVANTCNASETYIGWATKYGDTAGDFAPLKKLTFTEVLKIGEELADMLEVPMDLIFKTPTDGMCGMSDEEKFGFSYEELDAIIRDEDELPDIGVQEKVHAMMKNSGHKDNIKYPAPWPIYWNHEEVEF